MLRSRRCRGRPRSASAPTCGSSSVACPRPGSRRLCFPHDRYGYRAQTRTQSWFERRREALRPPLVVGALAARPDPDRGRRGPLLLGLRRQALPRLRVPARQRLARPPASEGHRGDQGAGGAALHDRADDGEREALRAGAAPRRGDARRPDDVVLHERRRRGERERDEARALVHRPAEDRRALPLLPRRDRGRDLGDRRPAPLARRARRARGSSASSTRTRTAARPGIPIRARSAPARRTSRRSSSTRGRRTSRP